MGISSVSEALLADELEKGIKSVEPNAHISFIESPVTSAGFPDVDMHVIRGSFKLELKFSDSKKPPKIRPSQIKWFRKRNKAHGLDCYVFAKLKIDGLWYYCLFDINAVLHLSKLKTSKQWREWASYTWKGYMDWKELLLVI